MPTAATNPSGTSTASKKNIDSALGKLFEHQLKDTYFAENAIFKALPKMMKAAQSEDLKKGFEKHLKQTQEHITRLEGVFKIIGRKAEGTPCEAIKGILKEGDEVAGEFGGTPACDAGLVASAQAVEHYEIARYGTLKAWARDLELEEAVELITATENEEIETDESLTELALTFNTEALKAA